MKIQKPTIDKLKPLYQEAIQNQTEDEWLKKILSAIAGILRKTPLRYRGYGPYWWPLKQALIDHGFDDFGEHVDEEWFDDITYGDQAYDVLAAWAYEETRFAPGLIITNPYHVLTDESGESFEFASGDEDMEMLDTVNRLGGGS